MIILPKTLILLGSGELGKEVAIAAKRLGCKVIACDRYKNAPAMQIADVAEVLDMTNPANLKKVICKHQPDAVIPEIEALAVNSLNELEESGIQVIPTARATKITMNRDQIRNLASQKLGLKTAKYAYASNKNELIQETTKLDYPLIIKPAMSSSGKGQTLVTKPNKLEEAFENAIKGARGKSNLVIIEEFVKFDLEITLLTIRQKDGSTIFCPPIGHEQSNGDYQCSWQPAILSKLLLEQAKSMAEIITKELGGVGLFGVEFFICGDEVIFSELSPRPHDTGLVTLMSQNINEFELHLRAILGIPIPEILNAKAAASRVILAKDTFSNVAYKGIDQALSEQSTQVFIFGKPNAKKGRRMGVAVALADTVAKARSKADTAASCIEVIQKTYQNR